MDITAIFGLQFVLSVVVFSLIAKWYVAPWLKGKPMAQALSVLILPHTFRYVGMSFLVPNLLVQPLPGSFANPAAYGDLVSGLLAILCLVALRSRWSVAIPLVWFFSVVGTVDLLNALRHTGMVPSFGVVWYIPTFIVPLLLVTHAMIFGRLARTSRVPE